MTICAQLARANSVTAPGREEPTHGELWVFGYGSLMWRPGFTYSLRCKAMLRGWRRSLCIYSHHYRGTPDRPGLVLGLDRGGACPGVAFRVEAALREPTIRYLREREQPTAVYIERMVPVTLESGDRVSALTFVADRMHRQYAGRLAREAMLERVRAGAGASENNRDNILYSKQLVTIDTDVAVALDVSAMKVGEPMLSHCARCLPNSNSLLC